MAKRLTLYILIGLVLGLLVGWGVHAGIDDGSPAATAQLHSIAGYVSIVTTAFLRLIKMIIAPLVFSTLVVGIAHMEDAGALGRVGLRSLGWFVIRQPAVADPRPGPGPSAAAGCRTEPAAAASYRHFRHRSQRVRSV